MYMTEGLNKIKNRFSNFEDENFRPGQEDAIRFTKDSGKKVGVIVGPTGSGKSLVGMVAGAHHKKFSYLCSSKNLQHQLVHDFPEARLMMGRNNFPCNLDESRTADLCIHTTTTPCRVKGRCYYEVHKRSVLAHPIQILNYHYFLHEANYVGGFSDYPIMVCDEADLIEGLLTGFIELRISKSKLDILRLSPPKYKTTTARDGLNSWRSWAEKGKAKVSERLASLRRYIESLQPDQELTRDDCQMVGELKTTEALSKKLTIFLEYVDESWLFEETPSGWVFQPTWLKPELSGQYFFRHAERFLFMSATMPPRAVLAQMLGINAGDIYYHEVPSAFPQSNRPVFLNPVADLTLKNFKDELPKLVKGIEKILDNHRGEKGMIHTVSWKLNQAVLGLNNPRLISHNTHDKDDALEAFKRSTNKVFVSPSSIRGVDLPDDLCRFVIIAKAPFQSLGDKLVSARVYGSGLGEFWYRSICAMDIVQASGRGVRHKDDYCTTYLLDRQIEKLVVDNQNLFPRYWMEAVDYA